MRFSKVDFSITPYVEGVTLPVSKPNPQFLNEIGEVGMRDLLDRFYMKLYESPISHLFPADREEMKTAAQHSADFFIQICGGVAYFNQNRGAPQMRKRHTPPLYHHPRSETSLARPFRRGTDAASRRETMQ